MTLGQKLREIRKKFGLSQEGLAEVMNVSRQAITKWENDSGLPDVSNLQELSKLFGITVDYLLDNNRELPLLSLRKELDKTKYKNKRSSYLQILQEYFGESYEIYVLIREKKMNFLESIIDMFVGGSSPAMIYPIEMADTFSDLSLYYMVKKDNIRLLVNIKNWVLEVIELPANINEKKFVYKGNKFRKSSKIKFSK